MPKRPHNWAVELLPQRRWRSNILSLSKPPKQVIIRKGTEHIHGDVTLSIDEFRVLIAAVRGDTSDIVDYTQTKPVECVSLNSDKEQVCIACGNSLAGGKGKRLQSTCNVCGLRYVASKCVRQQRPEPDRSLEAKSLDRPRDFHNCSICVYAEKKFVPHSPTENESAEEPLRVQLLVPSPNLYPGEAARRVLQTVEEILNAMLSHKPVFLDRERQSIVTHSLLERRAKKCKGDADRLKSRVMQNCVQLPEPQKGVGYIRVMGCRFVDKCKFGKDNQVRRQILGRVINGCSRKTVGTSGSLPAGHAVLPAKVLRTLGEPRSRRVPMMNRCFLGGTFPCSLAISNASITDWNKSVRCEGNAIRYPVIDKLNIGYAQLISGEDRWTADVPSSQFRYNGGDNDGDAFNFQRFTNGLLANSAYENRVCTAPAFNMCNNGQLKMDFDSDAKLGLGKGWKRELRKLRTSFFITGQSWPTYKRFMELEALGREKSRFGGVFSLCDYAGSLPGGTIRKMIDAETVPRLTLSHYIHSTQELGKQYFPYNQQPVTVEISSSLLRGLRPHEFAASCQATFDALADQKSSQMSLQGNLQYQFQYVMRPMVLSPDRKTVFNPVTRHVVCRNVSSLYAITRADASSEEIVKAALDFARIAVGLEPVFSRSGEEANSIRAEALQYLGYLEKRSM